MSKITVIASGKGGVGKTTTTINLDAAMKSFGADVMIIDGNLSTPNVGLHLNSPEVPVNLNHVLRGKAEPYEAVYEHASGIKIMPSSLSVEELKKTSPEKLKSFKAHFKKLSDIVLVDCAAGLGHETSSALELADDIIIVTNPEMPAITDALKTIRLAEKMKKPVRGIIVTRVQKDSIELEPEIVKEMLETQILGMVPEDIAVKKAIRNKSIVTFSAPKSNAARAYKEIAAKMLGVPYDSAKDKENLLEKFSRWLKLE